MFGTRTGRRGVTFGVPGFASAAAVSVVLTMLYRVSMLRVFQPPRLITTSSGTPARMSTRAPERRKSWKMNPGRPISAVASCQAAAKRRTGRPSPRWKTAGDVSTRSCQRRSTTASNRPTSGSVGAWPVRRTPSWRSRNTPSGGAATKRARKGAVRAVVYLRAPGVGTESNSHQGGDPEARCRSDSSELNRANAESCVVPRTMSPRVGKVGSGGSLHAIRRPPVERHSFLLAHSSVAHATAAARRARVLAWMA
jgi:hypothetical protein